MGDKVPRREPSSSRGIEDDVRWFGRGIEDDVKDLIEKCLQQYMNVHEVKAALRENFGIDPRLTLLVWRKLEEDNPQFFRDYCIRLKLIKQIEQFNKLLEHQLLLQELLAKRTQPQGGIYQQQLSNAMPVQYGDHRALNGTVVASMGSSAQALGLHAINQSESLTHASREQPMPSNCYLPLDPLGKCERGASPLPNQGRLSLPSNPASSSSPDLGEFETEADQVNPMDFLLGSPEHPDYGQLPDAPPEPNPGSQTPGKTY